MSPTGESLGIRMKKECEKRLRGLLNPDETLFAVGTAEELEQLGRDLGSGTGWTFNVLTDRRVLFAGWGRRDRGHHEIDLSDISEWADGTQYNSYVIVLSHAEMERQVRGVAQKLATALRTELKDRNLPNEALHFPEQSRAERTRFSHAILTRKDD